jgi:hypothetical protein
LPLAGVIDAATGPDQSHLWTLAENIFRRKSGHLKRTKYKVMLMVDDGMM